MDGELQLPVETDAADGVFEGGGVKGIAFVGALEAAEAFGIARWVNVAGTSAGAIVASLLAVGRGPRELRTILEGTDYAAFADYGRGGKWLGGAYNALRGRGVCSGHAFTRWLADQFEASPLGLRDPTFADLHRDLPADASPEDRKRAIHKLRVIASDVTEGRMLVLPNDLADYEDEEGRPLVPDAFPVARAVRMSMSFPYFFEPVTLRRKGRSHLIVDGGLLPNFPVFLFDGTRNPPQRWTLGFRLYGGAPPEEPSLRHVPRPLWPLPLAKAMFFAATEAWDRKLSEASSARTISIPTHAVGTLDFSLTGAEQEQLRGAGRQAGERFLREAEVYRNHSGVVSAGPAALTAVP